MDGGTIFGIIFLGLGIVLMICEAIWPDPDNHPRIIKGLNYDTSDDQT